METMAPDPNHRLLYIKVRRQTVEERGGLYEAVRAAWRLNPARAEAADWVVAVVGGVCEGVFEVHRWERSSRDPSRYDFHGTELRNDIARRYVGKRIPAEFRRRGMASPVLYGWGGPRRGNAAAATGGGAEVRARPQGTGRAEGRAGGDETERGGQELLLAITRCPNLAEARSDRSHACAHVVRSQRTADHQVPEPWSGRLDVAPILFVGSNPSIAADDAFPTSSWSARDTVSYFTRRFDRHGGWVSPEDFNAVRYWTMVRAHARALLARDAVPGVDFAMTDVVHCKSKGEAGVEEAVPVCADRWLGRVMRASTARVVVLLGRYAGMACGELWGIGPGRGVRFDVPVAGRSRSVVVLPHPNARERRKLVQHVGGEALRRLRESLRATG